MWRRAAQCGAADAPQRGQGARAGSSSLTATQAAMPADPRSSTSPERGQNAQDRGQDQDHARTHARTSRAIWSRLPGRSSHAPASRRTTSCVGPSGRLVEVIWSAAGFVVLVSGAASRVGGRWVRGAAAARFCKAAAAAARKDSAPLDTRQPAGAAAAAAPSTHIRPARRPPHPSHPIRSSPAG